MAVAVQRQCSVVQALSCIEASPAHVRCAIHCETYTGGGTTPAAAGDFVGIFPDESTDEAGTVQLPMAWRPVVLEQNVLSLFLELYSQLPTRTRLGSCEEMLWIGLPKERARHPAREAFDQNWFLHGQDKHQHMDRQTDCMSVRMST